MTGTTHGKGGTVHCGSCQTGERCAASPVVASAREERHRLVERGPPTRQLLGVEGGPHPEPAPVPQPDLPMPPPVAPRHHGSDISKRHKPRLNPLIDHRQRRDRPAVTARRRPRTAPGPSRGRTASRPSRCRTAPGPSRRIGPSRHKTASTPGRRTSPGRRTAPGPSHGRTIPRRSRRGPCRPCPRPTLRRARTRLGGDKAAVGRRAVGENAVGGQAGEAPLGLGVAGAGQAGHQHKTGLDDEQVGARAVDQQVDNTAEHRHARGGAPAATCRGGDVDAEGGEPLARLPDRRRIAREHGRAVQVEVGPVDRDQLGRARPAMSPASPPVMQRRQRQQQRDQLGDPSRDLLGRQTPPECRR